MQYSTINFAALAALITGGNALFTCTGYNQNTGGCSGSCTDHSISIGETINVPNVACVFNSVNNPTFDAILCGYPNLGAPCYMLSSRRRVRINENYNWDAGTFTQSIRRTHN